MGAGLGRGSRGRKLRSLPDSHRMLGSKVARAGALKEDGSGFESISTIHWLCALEQVTSPL